MDKADSDNSTPPDGGGKAEPNARPDPTASRSVPAVTRAPRPVRSIGGGYYVPPAPPVRYVPPAPPGFVAFADIPDGLACLAFVYEIPSERVPDRADLRAIARVIEFHLAAGHTRAAGICVSTGEMMWATAATWRTPGLLNGRRESVAFLALNGGAIRFSFPLRRQSAECYPILACWTLARMFGAQQLPAKPSRSVLRSIWKVESLDRAAPPTEAKRTEVAGAASDQGAIYRTGAAGRPSSMFLVRAEYQRRRDAGRTAPALAQEARELADWLEVTHPNAHPIKAKGIENGLRSIFERPPK